MKKNYNPMDKYGLDSHKVMYHPHRVSDWLKGKNIYPIYMEVSPAGACNHRCVFCGLDFMGYQKRYLETKIFKKRLQEMSSLGLKSIMYAGEGEPFLHKNMAELIAFTNASGIDVGITTNAVLMKPEIVEKLLGVTEWIKVSCNAGTSETYSKIHRTKTKDFKKVIHNIQAAVQIKQNHNYACTLGLQTILLPENEHEIEDLAMMCRDIGLDYIVVKPYSQHPQGLYHEYETIVYSKYFSLGEKLKKLNTAQFSAIFRLKTMQKWDQKNRSYKKCLGLPFWSYLDAGGNVWGCSVYLKDERFLYGNIYENTFKEIWEGEKRTRLNQWVESKLDVTTCRVNCRMDEVNRYLWNIKTPPAHVNFI